jgi:hypothetical protein
MLLNCKNGVSSYEIHRALDVTQKTAWFMLHRIRAAIKAKSFDKKLSGIVEADESLSAACSRTCTSPARTRASRKRKEGREDNARSDR